MAETDSNSRTTSRHRKKTHAAVQNSQTTDEPEPDSSKVVENELEEEGEDDIVHQMRCIVRKGRKLHLSDKDIQDLFLLSPVNRLVLTYFPRHFSALRKQQTRVHRALSTKTMSRKKVFWSCVCLVAVVLLFSSLPDFVDLLRESDCLLSSNHLLDEMFRPPMPCDVCRQLDSVPEVQNISRDDFRRNYAYSGVPVVVRGAARRSFANVT
ncbi:uncharacterized protein LOC101850228 [Aplysia californica]|uniref:Uncharacterized protein LOC101850228 n=1 Tax=Aplysia californica TaxID=6500 RepID=A0ABM0KAE3_APLCA|nr:uncharacterized protein LOC101850228 [Aplysia californica]